jgi:hypothetical protein
MGARDDRVHNGSMDMKRKLEAASMTTLKWKRDNDYPDEEIFRARKLSAVSGQYVISKNDGGQYVVWN